MTPRDRFKQRVADWARRLRVKPSQVRVQKMRRKWASCSTAGWVTFAEDLLRQPRKFQDFVIVHELLHLRLPNHGRLFKALLAAHVPDWREMVTQVALVRRGPLLSRRGT